MFSVAAASIRRLPARAIRRSRRAESGHSATFVWNSFLDTILTIHYPYYTIMRIGPEHLARYGAHGPGGDKPVHRRNASDKVLPIRAVIAGAYSKQADFPLAKQQAETVADDTVGEPRRVGVMALDHASSQAGGDEPGSVLEIQPDRPTPRAFGG